MALSILRLLLLDAIDSAHGYVYKPSKQTSPAENTPDGVNGWSPKPTPPPAFGGQARYGAMTHHNLFKRSSSSAAAVQTCGWFNGDGSQPLTCNPGYACAYITDPAPQWFSCCTTSTDGFVDWNQCPYYSTCYSFDSYSAPNTWTGSVEYAPSGYGSFYCPSASPYCNTFALTAQDTSTYQFLYCDTTEGIYDIYQNTYSSSAPAASSSSYTSPDAQPSVSIVTVTQSQSHTTTSPTLSFGAESSSSSPPTPTAGGGDSSSNTGAIAGGVVGGVAGIALLGAGIGYLVYRKKKARVEPMREVSIYSNNYSQPGQSDQYSQPGYSDQYSQPGYQPGYNNNGYAPAPGPHTTYSGNYSQNY